MINFRFHLISIIAVFLALGIGVIMGTAVIDSAVVDQLESQQAALERRVDEVTSTNDDLRARVGELEGTAEQLSAEGIERVLDGALRGIPTLVLADRGVDEDTVSDLVALLATADAAQQGTIWLTDRFRLDDDDELGDLADALDLSERSPASLRGAAADRLALALRPSSTTNVANDEDAASVIDALRRAGFLDVAPAPGQAADTLPMTSAATRILFVTGPQAVVPVEEVGIPLLRALVRADETRTPAALVLAATALDDERQGLVEAARDDEEVSDSVSTVDGIRPFAGQLAIVLSLQDAGSGRFGHYGREDGAQRLVPAVDALGGR